MRLVMVTCFNADWHAGRVPVPYVPLNLLGLASMVRESGHEPVVVDQTLALLDGRAGDGPGFHRDMAELILEAEPDVAGLTTMCNSYPQTLTLARALRELDPRVKIVLGGPQATVADEETMRCFPWIDAVVRGEADRSLRDLLDRWAAGRDPSEVPGVTWRGNGLAGDGTGGVVRNPAAPALEDLDGLPFPAYDLYDLGRIGVDRIPVEAGRGCPYSCTFCSTNVYFERNYRIKSAARLVKEMEFLADATGFARFDLIHDMLTVNREWVREFCREMRGRPYKWGCSARTDRVDAQLLAEMAEAGCMGVFFGVETGSRRLQPIIRKRLDVGQVLPVMRECAANGIAVTGSFITGFPEETADDAFDSLELALDILTVSPKASIQLHLLAPLAGSPLYAAHADDLRFDGHSSDISLFLLDDEAVELVRRHPKIFSSFYYAPTPDLDRELAKALSAAAYTCPLVLIALRTAGADIRRLLSGWPEWRRREVPAERMTQDYYMYGFALDLCRYLGRYLADVPGLPPYVRDFIAYFEVCYGLHRGLCRDGTVFRQFGCDVRRLGASLREGRAPDLGDGPLDLLFVNLAIAPGLDGVVLEAEVPRGPDPVVRPGDVLEIRDPTAQLLRRAELIVRNLSQRRVFAVPHHLDA